MNDNRNGKLRHRLARKIALALPITLVALLAAGMAHPEDNINVQFKGGIGVIPVTGVAANGAVNLNVVRGANPGAPWRIKDLEATVTTDGQITVSGHGLLLASGNGIGTNAGQRVHATLFCGPAATATAHDTNLAGVPLAADGDFTINDFLSPAPEVPCTNPVLLIRNPGGLWFAAGIPVVEDSETSKTED